MEYGRILVELLDIFVRVFLFSFEIEKKVVKKVIFSKMKNSSIQNFSCFSYFLSINYVNFFLNWETQFMFVFSYLIVRLLKPTQAI